MKKHTKIYLNYFGYSGEDFMPCEICGSRAVDIHHIHRRGMGGSTDADKIKNLMAVCRTCHIEYGDKKHYIDFLIKEHKKKLDGKS
jgi:ribosome-binding protein aMBF1 (putative translation factor)